MNTLHIIVGSPGAGKTTYGHSLAKDINACFLDIDTVSERLVRLSLSLLNRDTNDRDSSFFKTNFRDEIYQATFDIARENILVGDVVIVGPFTREIRDIHWTKDLEAIFCCKVEVHYVYCNPAERKKRIISRKNPRDKEKLENWDKINTYYGNEDRPLFPHHFIDTSTN